MAMVSHDTKTPLHGIVGLGSSPQDHVDLPVNMAEPQRMVRSCGQRLLDRVSCITDASRFVQNLKVCFPRDRVQKPLL